MPKSVIPNGQKSPQALSATINDFPFDLSDTEIIERKQMILQGD
ncbi:MAG: hypothetical protein ACHBN1_02825 [Heteroscytonema crispum UTEX LB 1556]